MFGAEGRLSAIAAALVLSLSTGTAAFGAMKTGDYTTQPIGHYEFCQRHAEECNVRSVDRGPVRLSRELWTLVTEVNIAVNRQIQPMSDAEIYGQEEFWDYPGDFGDCEDYVLEKRRLLHAAGVPLSDLLITVVRKPDGEGHAVLTLRTDRGDFVLDNLTDQIKPWREIGYTFLKRQASTHSGRWVAIDGVTNPLVGATRMHADQGR